MNRERKERQKLIEEKLVLSQRAFDILGDAEEKKAAEPKANKP